MKVKISQCNDKVTVADYFKVLDKTAFRFAFLNSILNEYKSAVMMVDTNQRKPGFCVDSLLLYLNDAGIEPQVMRISASPQNFLGFSIKTDKKQKEKLIVFQVTAGMLTRELFDALGCVDIAIGIGPKQELQEICENLRVDGIVMNEEYFEDSIYDSVLCARLRCTFNASAYIKDAVYEMGL